MAQSRLGLALNLSNAAPSQYSGFDMDSMCIFNGVCLGANENGIFTLFDADEDYYVDASDHTDISAYFQLAISDLGIPNQKRIRAMYFGYEADGSLQATIQMDEGTARTFTLTPAQVSDLQEGAKINGRRDQKGRYVTVKVANVSSSQFKMDAIDMALQILGRKPSGS